MKRFLFTAILATVSVVFFNSCKKEDPDTDTTSATDNSICESEFLRIMPTVNKIAITEPGVHRLGSGNSQTAAAGYSVYVDTAGSFPVIMTIDFGTGYVDSANGKTYRGKLICTITAPWQNNGTSAIVALDSFYVNSIHYEGTVTITRNSPTSFTQTVTNGKCSTSNWNILWNSSRTFEWTAGATTGTILDDVVQVSGTASGTDRNGKNFSVNVTSPIVRSMGCSWIQQGTMEITPDGKATRTVDFGTGTCDNRGTVTIEGNSFEFVMN